MRVAAAAPVHVGLRVRILASTPARASALARIVSTLGHAVVSTESDAELVLAGDIAPPHGVRAVVIGAGAGRSEGWLPEDASVGQIDAALRAVAAGLRVEPVAASRPAFGAIDESEASILLTARETEVLKVVSLGLSNKEIARELEISLHTVKFHLESLMRKLRASTRTQAVTHAMRLGLLEVLRI